MPNPGRRRGQGGAWVGDHERHQVAGADRLRGAGPSRGLSVDNWRVGGPESKVGQAPASAVPANPRGPQGTTRPSGRATAQRVGEPRPSPDDTAGPQEALNSSPRNAAAFYRSPAATALDQAFRAWRRIPGSGRQVRKGPGLPRKRGAGPNPPKMPGRPQPRWPADGKW